MQGSQAPALRRAASAPRGVCAPAPATRDQQPSNPGHRARVQRMSWEERAAQTRRDQGLMPVLSLSCVRLWASS